MSPNNSARTAPKKQILGRLQSDPPRESIFLSVPSLGVSDGFVGIPRQVTGDPTKTWCSSALMGLLGQCELVR